MIKQRGFSLIEPLLVVSIVALIVLMVNNYPSSVKTINQSRNSSIAREIAAKKIEQIRKEGYINLTVTTDPVNFIDSNFNNLPEPLGTYHIKDCPITLCSLGEKAKEVTVIVKWNENNETKNLELNSIVAENGLAQ